MINLSVSILGKRYYVKYEEILDNRVQTYLKNFIYSYSGINPVFEKIDEDLPIKPLNKNQIKDIHIYYMSVFREKQEQCIFEMFNELKNQGYAIENHQ